MDINHGQGISVNGVIKSFYNLKSVTVGFISIDLETNEETNYWSKEYTVNSNSFNLKRIDKDVSFSTLPSGKYLFYVKAVDTHGYEETLQDDPFLVKGVVVIATQGNIFVYINGETKPEWNFNGSINPTNPTNGDGCGTAYILAGTYWITKYSSNYKGHGAPAYAIHYSGNAINNSSEPIPCTRSPYPKNGCKVHGRSTYTEARIHQTPLNAGGDWSIGCIMVKGPDMGKQAMIDFSSLVGNYATLIVKR